MNDSFVLADKCMRVLCEHVGVIEAEQFIYFIKIECFDYTEWQREYYDAIPEASLQEAMIIIVKPIPLKVRKQHFYKVVFHSLNRQIGGCFYEFDTSKSRYRRPSFRPRRGRNLAARNPDAAERLFELNSVY